MGKNNPNMTTISISRNCKARLQKRRITKHGKVSFTYLIDVILTATEGMALT